MNLLTMLVLFDFASEVLSRRCKQITSAWKYYVSTKSIDKQGLLKSADDRKSPCFIGFYGVFTAMVPIILCIKDGKNIDLTMGSGNILVRDSSVSFYLVNEGLSILENMTLVKVPVPQHIMDLIGHIKTENDSDTEKIK